MAISASTKGIFTDQFCQLVYPRDTHPLKQPRQFKHPWSMKVHSEGFFQEHSLTSSLSFPLQQERS